jgi:hypothetical protein
LGKENGPSRKGRWGRHFQLGDDRDTRIITIGLTLRIIERSQAAKDLMRRTRISAEWAAIIISQPSFEMVTR